MNQDLEAFLSVDFQSVRQLRSIWKDAAYSVNSLNDSIVDDLLRYFEFNTRDADSSAIGRVILGPAGAGKTHLIGRMRQRIWDRQGLFILLDFAGVRDFWATTALCFVNSLDQPTSTGEPQYERLLKTIVSEVISDAKLRDKFTQAISEHRPIANARELADLFLKALSKRYRGQAVHADVVRALLLLVLGEFDERNIAYSWLQGDDLASEGVGELGFLRQRQTPIELVRGMSWLMSLAAPTLIAVDQIDAIVSEQQARRESSDRDAEGSAEARSIVVALTSGLMELHDVKHRAVTLVSCLEATWEILTRHGLQSATDRFSAPRGLREITSSDDARNLVEARLTPAYRHAGFHPPYPTWPVATGAFESAVRLWPREVLRACEDHQRRCEIEGQVNEMSSFAQVPRNQQNTGIRSTLDSRFEALKASANPTPLVTPKDEDAEYGDLLVQMFGLFRDQIEAPRDVTVSIDPGLGANPPLHARLKFTFHGQGERERQFAFRAIGQTSAIAFQSRLRAAMTASGVDRKLPFRQLIVIRSEPLPSGRKTQDMVAAFGAAGAKLVQRGEADLRIFLALETMAKEKPAGFEVWLRARKPLNDTELFRKAGLDGPITIDGARQTETSDTSATVLAGQSQPRKPEERPTGIPIGRRIEAGALGRVESIPTSMLPRHVAVLAGAGSGKTVLLRRIIEEAALARMPAIVIDSNNDLARLGEAWPERPTGFSDEDFAKAEAFNREVEVVIWTPGANAGRSISLALLPNFGALGDDLDEREQAVAMASSTLEPYVRGGSKELKLGVLADALRFFAKSGGSELPRLIDLLADLPVDASAISKAPTYAATIANQLRAAIATNPLLRSTATSLDIEKLFKGEGARTRISVVNLSGLATEAAQLAFVNQLQMSLFTWIKSHPSPAGRLYVLDEAQNFAPASKTTPCKGSSLGLAAQARKYKLAMLFATQSPKGLDNKIVQNCTTQFYGKMGSPAAIDSIRELVAAKGGAAPDIGTLTAGTFYFSTEGSQRPIKVKASLCLGFHGQPLTPDEVVARAHVGTAGNFSDFQTLNATPTPSASS